VNVKICQNGGGSPKKYHGAATQTGAWHRPAYSSVQTP